MSPSLLPRVVDAALEATVIGSFSRVGPAVRSRLDDWRPVADLDLTGRTVLVTGGNGGHPWSCWPSQAPPSTVRSEERADR